MSKTVRNVCFTANNYTAGSVTRLQALDWIQYGIAGAEVGESGTPHLQGYIQLKKSKRLKAVTDALTLACGHPVHTEAAKGNYASNREYCSKGGKFDEWGEPRKGQGSRGDIAKFLTAAEQKSELDLARDFPEAFVRYYKAAERVRTLSNQLNEANELKKEIAKFTLWEWQNEAILALDAQDNRTVLWYVDEKGGRGKSTLAKWLCVWRDAFYVQGGKGSDIAHAYQGETYVVFDLTRDKEEICSYSMIERFKDGMIFSPKYETKLKVKAKGCKVIVFSNWHPDKSKLSEDRWEIVNLPAITPFTIAKKAKKRSKDEMEAESAQLTENGFNPSALYQEYEDKYGGYAQPRSPDWDTTATSPSPILPKTIDLSDLLDD